MSASFSWAQQSILLWRQKCSCFWFRKPCRLMCRMPRRFWKGVPSFCSWSKLLGVSLACLQFLKSQEGFYILLRHLLGICTGAKKCRHLNVWMSSFLLTTATSFNSKQQRKNGQTTLNIFFQWWLQTSALGGSDGCGGKGWHKLWSGVSSAKLKGSPAKTEDL